MTASGGSGRGWSRRPDLAVAAALLAAAVGCATPEPPDLTSSNLLLITIDTLRADHLGSFGDEAARTPHIDRLATDGVTFTSCYAHVPLTLPSHATLFTGRLPFEIGVRTNGAYFLRSNEVTLAERLADLGYDTAAFVSSYVLGSKFGLDQGFRIYDDTIEEGDVLQAFTSEVSADRVVDRFLGWLEDERPQQFFAWLHFYDPHLPYEPPTPFLDHFADDPYRGEIAFVDSQIGRALQALEDRSARDRTLVVVTSDHGEAFGEHGEVGHGLLAYDESLRVPLVVSGPGLPSTSIDARVRLVDLFPTLLELLGLEPGEPTEGRSLVPLLTGGAEAAQRTVYFESLLGPEDYNWAPITGVISGDHKYIAVPQPELYDLVRDPAELDNLYRTQTGIAEDLDGQLRALLLDSGDSSDSSRRELSEEDAAHLRALGYLGSAEVSETALDPKLAIRIENRMTQIRVLLEEGELDRAARDAQALADEFEALEMAGLYALRHEVAARRGRSAEAIDILERGLEALPDSERLRFLLANVLLKTGRPDEAAALARRLLEANPRFSQAWIVLGQAAEQGEEFSTAVAHYDKALELESRSLPLRRRRAEALIRSGAVASGLAELVELARTGAFANEPEQIYRTAVLASQLGDGRRAEELFRIGLDVAPGGVHHVTFALMLLQSGETLEARSHLEVALDRYGSELSQEQRSVAEATLAKLSVADNGR